MIASKHPAQAKALSREGASVIGYALHQQLVPLFVLGQASTGGCLPVCAGQQFHATALCLPICAGQAHSEMVACMPVYAGQQFSATALCLLICAEQAHSGMVACLPACAGQQCAAMEAFLHICPRPQEAAVEAVVARLVHQGQILQQASPCATDLCHTKVTSLCQG